MSWRNAYYTWVVGVEAGREKRRLQCERFDEKTLLVFLKERKETGTENIRLDGRRRREFGIDADSV